MPYHEDIRKLFDDVLYWADLRHEQRAEIAPLLHRLQRELTKTKNALELTKPDAKLSSREPNSLNRIHAARPDGPRKLCTELPAEKFASRLRGAWLGRAAGCTLGVPVEGWEPDAMAGLAELGGQTFPPNNYWAAHPKADQSHYKECTFRDYLRESIHAVPVDDDLAYTQLGLLILEEFGPRFATRDVAAAWMNYVPIACTAEEVALRNLNHGIGAMKAGDHDNPYQEWIGADIRSDPWGYAAPGWPERAAEMAYHDAYLTHRRNGLYGAMFFAAAIAAAFVVKTPIEAIRIGLSEIPHHCRLAADVRWALSRAPHLKDWRDARRAVDVRFKGMHAVHTNNNSCLTIFGLYLGKTDFTRTIGYTVAMGLDNDCTAATAGSIFGAVYGIERIPEHWWKPFGNKVKCYLRGKNDFTTSDLLRRFTAAAHVVWSTA